MPQIRPEFIQEPIFLVGGELERFRYTAFETSLFTHRPTFRTVDGGLSLYNGEVIMTNPIQEPSGYKLKSRFNVIQNGKPLARAVSYPHAYNVAHRHQGSVIKFASFAGGHQ